MSHALTDQSGIVVTIARLRWTPVSLRSHRPFVSQLRPAGRLRSVTGQPSGTPKGSAWDRWRRPVALTFALVFVVSQWERLSSGEPFTIATGIGVVCFFTSAMWRRPTPPRELRTSADAWRDSAKERSLFFGFWFAVACIWLATAALLYEVRPMNLIVPALPGVFLATSLVSIRGAEKFAALHARAEARTGTS
jgi:hypothetical protein